MTINIDIQKSAQMPLHAQIRKQILSMIESGALQQDSPIPPEMELVEKYGISRTVVRHALNDLTDEGYLYRIRGKGTFVSAIPKKGNEASDFIALVMPSQQTGSMFSDIVVGCQSGAASSGFDMIYSNSQNSPKLEKEYIEQLKSKVKGFIIFLTDEYTRTNHSRKLLESLQKENIPFVLIDRHISLETDFVGTDNFAGAYEAASELIKAAYDNVACVICDDWKHQSALIERLDGYRKAVKENNRKEIVLEMKRHDCDVEKLRSCLTANPHTGFFAAESWCGAGVLSAISLEKLNIPADAGIIVFDKMETYTDIPLSTVIQPMKAIGDKAAKLLIERIKGNKSTNPMQIRLKPELILNGSTKSGSEVKRRAS